MRIKNYLFHSFAQIFFPIFFVLFFIASVVIFIRIAGVTFVVKISFFELLSLYFYTLPLMIFFVIPLSFFVACTLSLSRLSFDYELPVLFALGMNPSRIIKIFLPIAILVSFSLFILSLVLTPLSDTAYRQFLEERKNSININLQAGEFGQKLGDWLVYVQKSKEDLSYEDIVLLSFAKEGGMIFSDNAKIVNQMGVVEAILEKGSIYRPKEDFVEKILFDTLIIRSSITAIDEVDLGVIGYWKRAFYENERQKKTLRNLSMYVIMSCFPLVSLFFFPLLGIKNPRYQKNYTILQAMGVIGIFYALMYLMANYLPLLGMFIFPTIWLLLGYLLFERVIKKYY